MSNFAFNLNDMVALALSAEKGVVIGRAEYAETTPQYFVRYVTANGQQMEGWFAEGALNAA